MKEYVVNGDLFTFEDCKNFYDQVIVEITKNDELSVNFINVVYISSTAVGIFFSIQQVLAQLHKKIKITHVSRDIEVCLNQFEASKALPNIFFKVSPD